MKKFLNVKLIAIILSVMAFISGAYFMQSQKVYAQTTATTTDGIIFNAQIVERNIETNKEKFALFTSDISSLKLTEEPYYETSRKYAYITLNCADDIVFIEQESKNIKAYEAPPDITGVTGINASDMIFSQPFNDNKMTIPAGRFELKFTIDAKFDLSSIANIDTLSEEEIKAMFADCEISTNVFFEHYTNSEWILYRDGNTNLNLNCFTSINYSTTSKVVEQIQLNKHVMLKDTGNENTRQNVYVTFGLDNLNTDAYIYELTVGIALNNKQLTTLKISENESNKKYYEQYFDLSYNEYADGTPILGLDNQGTYTFNFTYRVKNGANLSESKTTAYSFTVLDQKYYADELTGFKENYKAKESNSANIVDTAKQNYVYAPYLENIKKDYSITDLSEGTTGYGNKNDLKYHTFYNYENRNNVPTLTFRNDQYTITVTRSYYAQTSTFTVGNGVTELNNDRNYGVKVSNQDKTTTINFLDLGIYVININYCYNGTVLTENNSQKMLICSEELINIGAQAYYAHNTISEKELHGTESGAYIEYDSTKDYTNSKVEAKELKLNNAIHTIPTTNQAPVWFKYLGNIQSSSCYYKWNVSSWDAKGAYINGYKFQDSGIYLVKIDYKYASYTNIVGNSNNADVLTQWFCFEIENKTPVLKVYAQEQDGNAPVEHLLGNNALINKNVNVEVELTESEFNSDVVLKVYKDGIDYLTINGAENINSSNKAFQEEGTYIARLYYGAYINGEQVTYTETIFTIDKQAPAMLYECTEELNATAYELKDFLTVKNKAFKITYEKNLKDFKELTYQYATLTFNSAGIGTQVENDKLYNGYSFGVLSNSLEYSPNTEIKQDGLYIFTLTDLAGNTTVRAVIIDRTSMVLLQKPVQQANNPYNVHTDAVTVYTGEYKALKADNVAQTLKDYEKDLDAININFNLSAYFDEANDYKVRIDEDEKDGLGVTINVEDDTPNDGVKPPFTFNKEDIFNISGVELIKPPEDSAYYYDITLTDALYNTYTKSVEINADMSLGMIYANGDLFETNDADIKLRNNSATNLKNVRFEFLPGEEQYEVVKLTYTYYPLTFDKNSANYPFAQSPAIKDKDLLASSDTSTIDETKKLTDIINPTYSSLYENVTAAGYYVITRTYKGTGNETTEDEINKLSKNYTFVVDRNNIKADIGYDENGNEIYTWGSEIYFTFDTAEGPKNYTNFITNVSNDPINPPDLPLITTNKVPVVLNVPQYKYNYNNDFGFIKLGLEIVIWQQKDFESKNLLYTITNEKIVIGVNEKTIKSTESDYGDQRANCLKFIDPAIYTVEIRDTTYNNKSSSSEDGTTNANTLSFMFKIELNKPSGKWTSESTNYNSFYEILNTTSNYADFTFTNINDITKAEIDTNNITLQRVTGNQVNDIDFKLLTTDLPNGKSYTVRLEDLNQADGSVYELTIQYNGKEEYYKQFFKQTYYLIIDKTKPTYTIQNLLNNDAYGNKEQYVKTNNKGEYSIDDNYFFVVDSNFKFEECSDEFINAKYPAYTDAVNDLRIALKKTETNSSLYYRQYNKFKPGEANLTSVLPDDVNYSNYDVQRDRPRFNVNNSNYHTFNYGSSIDELETGYFYEIIEVDGANNYSSFTIYVSDDKVATLNYTNTTEFSIQRPDPNNSNEDANIAFFTLNSLSFNSEKSVNDMFYTVEVILANGETKIVHFDYEDFELAYDGNTAIFKMKDENESVNEINKFIKAHLAEEIVIQNGTSFTINLYSRLSESPFNVLEYNFNVQGTKKLNISYRKNNADPDKIDIIIPAKNGPTWIDKIEIYEVVNGDNGLELKPVYTTDESFEKNTETILTPNNLSSSKVYYVVYEDSFDYKQYMLINFMYEDDVADERLQYNQQKSTFVNGHLVTADNVSFTYQSQLYSVEITKNGKEFTSELKSTSSNGKTTITFYAPDNYTSNDTYVITIHYLGFESEDLGVEDAAATYTFTINTVLPEIQLKDFLNNILYSSHITTNELNTAQRVFISWNNAVTDFNPDFKIEFTGKNSLTRTYTMSELNNGKSYFTEIGSYKIIQTNGLNNTRTIQFYIIDDSNMFYWVEENLTKNIIKPSNYKFTYNDKEIEFYNTTLEFGTQPNQYSVIANIDKNMNQDYIETIVQNGINIKIFKISGNTTHKFETYIAVATIPQTNTILTNTGFKINGASTSANPYSGYGIDGVINVSWNSYHLIEANPITAYISYNNSDFIELTGYTSENNINSIALTVGGLYKFYFKDDAGNTHTFNINTVKQSNTLSVNLVNSVWFNVKAQDEIDFRTAINNEVFNQAVMIQISGSQHIQKGSLTYTVTRNGVETTLSRVGDVITATEVGLYHVTFNAIENVSGLYKNISSSISFTIINNNEARLAFDYSTSSNQTVTKVEKLIGTYYVDVTDEILRLNNISSITHLLINDISIGVGKYNIYVKDITNANLSGTKNFMFNVWVNNQSPALILSREFGTSATSNVAVQINKGLIASDIGECKLIITNYGVIEIPIDSVNEVTTIKLTAVGDYHFTIISSSGQILLSNKITISEKLNSVAIIVIVIVSVALAVGLFLFFKLRTRMRVR